MDTGDLELVRHEISQALGGFNARLDEIAARTGMSPEEVRSIVAGELESFRVEMAATMQHVEAAAEAQVEAAIEAATDEIEETVEDVADAIEDAVDSLEDAADDVEEAVGDTASEAEHDVDEAAVHVESALDMPLETANEIIEEKPRRSSWWNSKPFARTVR